MTIEAGLPVADMCPLCESTDVWSDAAEEIAKCKQCGFDCYVGPASTGYTWQDWFSD